MVTHAPAVRARIEVGDDPRFERLRDPFTAAILAGAPLALERYATRWTDRDAVVRLASDKRAPLEPALAAALRAMHERLGAPAASLAAIDRLARGEAVAAVAGQQPAPLGGPLYSLHKTAATLGLARRVEARTGVPCVPVFWMHGEDSDFAEIRSITIADPTLGLHDLELPGDGVGEGTLLGGLPLPPVAALGDQAIAVWDGLPNTSQAAAVWRGALARARDLGELQSALMLGLFGAAGLVVVDPRLPEFRAAARPWIDRYLAQADTLGAAARTAGARLEALTGRRPLADASLDSFVFAVTDGTRHKVSPAAARALPPGTPLVPSVALRPVLQDAVLPTVAMACGPGELAYLAQLREVFEGLGVHAASPVPRFGATWLPPAALALIEASGADPWEVVTSSDAVMRQVAGTRIPAPVREELERARDTSRQAFERLAASSRELDPSLPQMVDSARGKVDYQFARLAEGYLGKARNRLEREHPDWVRLRYYLAPGDRLQERRLASLEPVAHRGIAVTATLADLAEDHAARLEEGHATHVLLDL